jgi:protoporphyrinogen oxidase
MPPSDSRPDTSAAAQSTPHVARAVSRLRPGDRIVVIGAGPAGLTAAYLLSKQGYDVTVLEGTDEIGGISKTAKYKGYRFDIGGHRFFTKITPVQALWEELLADEFIDVPRLSRIHYRGKYFNYPLKAMNALTGLGLVNAVRIVFSYIDAQINPSPVEETLDQWVTNRFGRRLYEIFFKTYTEKVWGIPCTEVRAEWAAQRIQGLSLARAILSATSLNKRSTDIKSLINSFKYPRFGPGQMWETCAQRVRELCGTVHMNHLVTRIELTEGRATAVVAQTPDGERRFEADHLISTTDIRALVRALGDAAPAAVRTAGEGLAYRDFLTVALILERRDLFPDNWIYVHTPGVKVGRIQNFNNWSAAMVPNEAHTCLGLEYFCFEGDGLWNSTDAARHGEGFGRSGWHRRAHAQGVSHLRRPVSCTPRQHSYLYRSHPEPAHRRSERDAQVQQRRPLDVHRDADAGKHAGCVARRMGREYRFRLPRGTEGGEGQPRATN